MEKENNTDYFISQQDVVNLMKDLISIKSPYFEEDEIIEFVQNWFSENHLKPYVHEYYDAKVTKFKGKNVILNLHGQAEGPTICLNGHLDSVKLCNGWSLDPYQGTIENGNIYGVGALDMKSGCCSIMLAVKKFVENHNKFKGKIITTLVSDEEGPYGLGTNALIEDGLLSDVDFSIVAEPSAGFIGKPFPVLCLGARGGYGLEIELFGKSAHAALPELGLNAAGDASRVVCALNDVINMEDELLGRDALCVVAVESNGGACSVPDYAKVKLFWHIVRGENEDTIRQEIEKAIQRAKIKCDYKINFREAPSEGSKGFMPFTVDRENEYVKTFIKSIKEVCGKEPSIDYFQSIGDFNYLGSRLNAPTVIFGAEGKNFHSSDEHASISSIVETAEIIYCFLKKMLL